jgi:hypothetical protein
MTGSIEATTDRDLFAQVMDYANRANPHPLYARLRETPVLRAVARGDVRNSRSRKVRR